MTKARDVMSSPVITVQPDTPVRAAAALLVSHGYTAAPVVENGRVIGIVTEASLMRDQIRPEGWLRPETWDKPIPQTVREAMTGTPIGMSPDSDLTDVVSLMLEANLRSIPVIDDGDLVGIISRRDVLRVVARGELTSEDTWRQRAGSISHPHGEAAPAAGGSVPGRADSR
jgi:CBS domain-containing protein